ncbi:MAG: hypothetical protein ACR2N2_11070 [Acidimicrobiia bacterium]
MRFVRTLIAVSVVALLLASCGGDDISAQSCDEVVDETVALIQKLIDDVDSEFGELSVQDFIASGGELPSIESFESDAAEIDAIAAELGCTQSQISAGLESRAGELTASTDLGRFLIDAIRAGGL